jgi:hypothetical protein
MSAVDTLADKAQAASRRLAGSNGLKAKLAQELAEDAAFLRKLKPGLIAKRARGELPANGGVTVAEPTPAPAVSEPRPDHSARGGGGGGPNPFVVVGAAFVAGVLLAKWIDWRGHAHPRW